MHNILLQIQGINDPVQEMYFLIGFVTIIILLLIIDLGFFNSEPHKISNKEAVIWSCVWIGIATIFGGFVYWKIGPQAGSEYFTAFLIEKALSVDNLFVFILVFGFFKVPPQYQHKVLFWGIIGAIVLRAVFIFSGVWLVEMSYLPVFEIAGHPLKINIILTIFGFFLVYAGIKSVKNEEEGEGEDFSKSFAVRLVSKIFPISDSYDGEKFITVKNGVKMATPLLLVIAVIESTDLIFAVDSIPAIFAVSNDPFILYTSNIFAILGLRSLYFLLANSMHVFSYLKYGLAFILTFIGFKMVAAPLFHISSPISLTVVGGVLLLSALASVIWKPQAKEA